MTDFINCLFEIGSALFIWMNVFRLYKDKRVLGVSLLPSLWFCFAGAWRLHFYLTLGAFRSSISCGISLFASIVWLLLAFEYQRSR
jgi:hypothetical protein